ncbi:MAG: hypothetical protein JWR60_2125 [Polaromonas sp.]|nr:hypothetical protein [Polaromonas sp.]
MTISSKVSGAAYQTTIDHAFKQAPMLIERWCMRLADAMHERARVTFDPAERNQIQSATVAFNKYRPDIQHGFAQQLRKVIDAELAASSMVKKPVQTTSVLSSVRFDQLELMKDVEVQDAVERERLIHIFRRLCESGQAVFTARLSTAQGFAAVKADSNPIRLENMTQALLRQLRSLPVPRDVRALWLVDGGQIMGEELQLFYLLLRDFLADQGIAPAGYRLNAPAQGKPGAALAPQRSEAFQAFQKSFDLLSGERDEEVSENKAVESSRNQFLTLDHLHHLLTGDYESSAHAPFSFADYSADDVPHHEFAHTVPAALDVLTELEEQGLAPADVMAARHAPSEPVAQLRARFKTAAKTLGQSVSIEVVGLMIEKITHDERLLQPVRQVIASAEPAFLRLALTDSRFFSDKSHAARRLLDVITNTSLGYASEEAAGFAEFMQGLQEVAALLQDENTSDAEHFAEILQNFERRQNRNTPLNRQMQRRAVQALLQAEQRNMMAVKIAGEIRARPDFVDASRIITAFLTGPWAQVMARERLFGESSDSGSARTRYSLTLGDVLWSLGASPTSSHRKRLVKMIPGMLQSLRDGLVSIAYPLEQTEAFFDELMAVHQAALKATQDTPEPETRHALEKMFVAHDEPEESQLWLAPSEVQHSGFMEDWDDSPSIGAGSNSLEPQKDSQPAAAESAADMDIELNLGDWIDLLVDMQWKRAQLTWVSPHNTLFMFTSEGGRKHSMTSRVLGHLLGMGLVKVISQQGVVDGALDSVAFTAMRNSVKDPGIL